MVPTVAPLLFPVSALLSSGSSSSSSHFAPSYPLLYVASHLQAPVPASSFLIVSSTSSATVVSWSLPVVITCSAPPVSSLAAPAHTLVPPVVSLDSVAPPPPSSLLPPVTSFPSVPPAPLFSFTSSGVPGVPHSSLYVSAGLGFSASRCPCGSFLDGTGTSGTSYSHDNPFTYRDFEDSLMKGEESPVFGKADFSRAFYEVVDFNYKLLPSCQAFIFLLFQRVVSVDGCFGCVASSQSPDLSLFDKLLSVSKEI